MFKRRMSRSCLCKCITLASLIAISSHVLTLLELSSPLLLEYGDLSGVDRSSLFSHGINLGSVEKIANGDSPHEQLNKDNLLDEQLLKKEKFPDEQLFLEEYRLEKKYPIRRDDISIQNTSLPAHAMRQIIVRLKADAARLLKSLLRGYRTALLLDLPMHENKGDSAITVGELNILAAINMKLLNCYEENTSTAVYNNATKKIALEEIDNPVILATGGGNFGTWPTVDRQRVKALSALKDYKYVLLSQSMHFFNDAHYQYVHEHYSRHSNMTVLLRDKDSFIGATEKFKSLHTFLAPDMAFGIGAVNRFLPPVLDIIWINRVDKEKRITCNPEFPPHIHFLVKDWLTFPSPRGQNIIDSNYIKTFMGFFFLQRGKVLVTDRLHGYILGQLLDIPTVLIDNKIKKLTNFRSTWIAYNVDNAVLASDTQDAVAKSMMLLEKVNMKKAAGF